jgi:crotonobetainyl-CoA:carnitine CoA-transferase CaiB-like acyl-CoA transferase
MAARTTDDWLAVLGGEVPFAPVRNVADALENPFVTEVGMRDLVDHPDREGGLHMLANPVKIDGRRAPGVRAPKLGEHTAKVLGR